MSETNDHHDASVPDVIAAREAVLLAPYAMHSADSAGRVYPEPPHPYRGPFQRDRDRIVHSAAYRRLSFKTQVFTGELGDYHRTRLTHTIEVGSIARTIARALKLNEDLVETLALAHDIGHPPFGHAGEDVLDECLSEEGGFNHNSQALRIVEQLEIRYPPFPGLNLSKEVLAGQARRAAKNKLGDGTVDSPLLEVQVVDAADSTAYDTHDVDDALELGLLTMDALLELSLWREAAARVRSRFTNLSAEELRRAVLHELIDWQVNDVLTVAGTRLAELQPESAAAVATLEPMFVPSRELAERKEQLERFLHEQVYRHPDVSAMRTETQAALREMFEGYVARPELLPSKFRKRADDHGLRRTVADYLAGMTDRYALREHRRLFATTS
jgi:dGTPase